MKTLVDINGVTHDLAVLSRLDYCPQCNGHTDHSVGAGELCFACEQEEEA